MHKLRGSPRIIVLLFYFLYLWIQASGFCPHQCKCNDDLLRVLCDSANLETVPITLNPELKEIHLSNNRITALKLTLHNYRNLEYLDGSENILDTLDKGNFNVLQNLKSIFLSSNNISIIKNETFQGLVSLKELYLNKNSLEVLLGDMFLYLENLELLDLSQNKIAFIHDKAFYGLNNLKTLLLKKNKLSAIPTSPFQHISKLNILDLGFNFFESIPESSFAALRELKDLSLDSCGIHDIMHGAFKFLNSLLVLHIHNNELIEIPTKALFDVIRLEELHIGQNKFLDIRPQSFQRLKFLHTINISGCQILESIGKNVFSDNLNIKSIIISNNKELRQIHDSAFQNLQNIKHISFRANAFETFQQSLLPWNDLISLDIRDNPLVCNCSILWLWKLLVTKNFSSLDGLGDASQVACVSPPELKNKILANLSEINLDCFTLDAKRQIIIGIILAAAVASAAIVMVGFRYRRKVTGVLKNKWGFSRKEPQYQKTSIEEECTILQAAHQSLKMTPVTEL